MDSLAGTNSEERPGFFNMNKERKTSRRIASKQESKKITLNICEGCKQNKADLYLGDKIMYLCQNCYNLKLSYEIGKNLSEAYAKRIEQFKLIKMP